MAQNPLGKHFSEALKKRLELEIEQSVLNYKENPYNRTDQFLKRYTTLKKKDLLSPRFSRRTSSFKTDSEDSDGEPKEITNKSALLEAKKADK